MADYNWIKDATGALMVETGLLLLVVKQVSGSMRFLVFARRDNGPRMLIKSGTRRNAAEAMTAAEIMAGNYGRAASSDGPPPRAAPPANRHAVRRTGVPVLTDYAESAALGSC